MNYIKNNFQASEQKDHIWRLCYITKGYTFIEWSH